MAFGQQSGPPATHRQVEELLHLLQAAGHDDFRDARHPMGFTQRQAAGKFTRDEADAFIERLQAEADAAAEPGPGSPPDPDRTPSRRPLASASRAPAATHRALRQVPTEQLAAELQHRGWVVIEP